MVGSIHEAALDAGRWPGLLKNMASAVGASAGTVWTRDFAGGSASFDAGNGNVAAPVGCGDSATAEYARHYGALNVWASQTDRLPSGWARSSPMPYPDSLFRRTEFCAGRLAPHLQSAMKRPRKLHCLEALGTGAMAALDLLSFGVILLTRAGSLMHVNRAAQAMVVGTGALLFEPGGALRAANPGAHHRLQALIRGAVATGAGLATPAGGALRLQGPVGKSLQVVVAPLPASPLPFSESAAGALFCSDTDAAVAGLAASLQQLYGMSPAEAALTEALVNGRSLKEFAEQRRTSLNTVRTQLKGATAKAGAKRQADLVRVVLTGPALWRQRG